MPTPVLPAKPSMLPDRASQDSVGPPPRPLPGGVLGEEILAFLAAWGDRWSWLRRTAER